MMSHLLLVLVLTGCSTAGVNRMQPASASPAYKVVSFDSAFPQELDRSVPLAVAFPQDYEMVRLTPIARGVVWARSDDAAQIKAQGKAPAGAAFFIARPSSNVSYNRIKGTFDCGPGCGEGDIPRQLGLVNSADVKTEKRMANGVPLLFIEADTSAMKNASAKRLYMVYVSTSAGTDTVVISFRPSASSNDQGRAVWAGFKTALAAAR